MAIKVSLEKLTLPQPFLIFMVEQLRANGIVLLNINPEHAGIVATLPFHHRDPFDRPIISQAMAEDMPIIGKDMLFDAYTIHRNW